MRWTDEYIDRKLDISWILRKKNLSWRILVADVVKPDMGESDSKKSIETWLKTSLAFRNVITRATPHRFAHGKKQIGGGSLFYKKQPINCRDSLLSFYYELKLWMSEGSRLWCILGIGACAQAETAWSLATEFGAQGVWKQVLQENYDIIDVFIDWKIDFDNLFHHTTYFYHKYRFNLSETYSQVASGHRLAKWVTEHWSVIATTGFEVQHTSIRKQK